MNKNGKINYVALSACIGLVGILAVANIAIGFKTPIKQYCDERITCQKLLDNAADKSGKVDLDTSVANVVADTQMGHYPVVSKPDGWYASDGDIYYLAKIVKCEAGICSLETKVRHAMVVLNRVWSDSFPNTVYEVITQHRGDVYQFSPVIPGGTWYTEEPDDECYEAVCLALNAEYDISNGATFFEATGSDSVWHQQHLVQVCESDGVRFYKVP